MKNDIKQVRKKLENLQNHGKTKSELNPWLACVEEAIEAGSQGNYPVGSVVTDKHFNILGRGRNAVFRPKFRSDSHAEMSAINAFEAIGSVKPSEAILFSTLEPCLMCAARILLSGIPMVKFLYSDQTGGSCRTFHLFPPNYQELAKRVHFEECRVNSELRSIAISLYEIGERIWSQEYNLKS